MAKRRSTPSVVNLTLSIQVDPDALGSLMVALRKLIAGVQSPELEAQEAVGRLPDRLRDAFEAWLAERTVADPKEATLSADLIADFNAWRKASPFDGGQAMTRSKFGLLLSAAGFKNRKTCGLMARHGIRLLEPADRRGPTLPETLPKTVPDALSGEPDPARGAAS